MNNNDVEVPLDIHYELHIKEKIRTEHTLTQTIIEWLLTNLTSLKDNHDKPVFSKVNYGFNEGNLKSFGSRPVCDVYIDNVEYDNNFDQSLPNRVKTIIIFYFKGANNNSYLEACKLHDYLMQEFMENTDWKQLTGFVSDTLITGSRVINQSIRKSWGVIGALELTHKIY